MNFFAGNLLPLCRRIPKLRILHHRFYSTPQSNLIMDETFDPEMDDLLEVEQKKQELLSNSFFTGMRVVFLGTASQKPSSIRNVSAIALQLEKQTWLFDCGEGTSKQIVLSPHASFSKLNKIFITHMHGDHVYGLPTVILTSRGRLADKRSGETLSVYGPPGVRSFVNSALFYTHTSIGKSIDIKELLTQKSIKSPLTDQQKKNDIQPDSNGVYTLFSDASFTVKAKYINHTVPCFGYVIEEAPGKPNVDVEKAKALGLEAPNVLFKELKAGNSVTLSNGTVIKPEDILIPAPRPRKIVILGDTNNPYSLTDIAQGADLVIHEATLPNEFENIAHYRGHSSPRMAGLFAKAIGAKKLAITHFGGAYANELEAVETVLLNQAKEAFQSNEVIAARDFLAVDIPKPC